MQFAIAGSAVWSSHAVSVWQTSSHIRGMNYVLLLVWKSYLLNSYRRYETRWDENHTLLVWNSCCCFCCAFLLFLLQPCNQGTQVSCVRSKKQQTLPEMLTS